MIKTIKLTIFLGLKNRIKKKKSIELAIERTRKWIVGMQSKNGGWGAFDINNTRNYLNYIPFADHGALLDPPTADVSARCLSFLAQIQNSKNRIETNSINQAIKYLLAEQEKDGSWFGRWGTNYIYGTWSVLAGLGAINEDHSAGYVQKAIKWLKENQNDDGSWHAKYNDITPIEYHKPTHFAPYIAVAALHYYKIFKDKEKIKELWPTIQSSINFSLNLQNANGTIPWLSLIHI